MRRTEAKKLELGQKFPGVLHSASDRNRRYEQGKRLQDVILSAFALVVLFPFMVVIAVAIVLDDPWGSPIFAQTRVGQDGRTFTLYKFRTMCADAERIRTALLEQNEMQGPVFKMREDPRVTRVGKLLRRSCADELPQLFNVLMGDMSLVGPRPGLPEEVADYDDFARLRLGIQPGITCLWQCRQDRYGLTFGEWVDLDLRYIRERSFWMDWKIILATLRTVVKMNGI